MNPYTLYLLSARRTAEFDFDLSVLVYKLVDRIVGAVSALDRRVARWNKRRKAISELSGLSDHLLRDIGVSRGEIRHVVDGLLDAPEAVRASRPRLVAESLSPGRTAAAANDNAAGLAA